MERPFTYLFIKSSEFRVIEPKVASVLLSEPHLKMSAEELDQKIISILPSDWGDDGNLVMVEDTITPDHYIILSGAKVLKDIVRRKKSKKVKEYTLEDFNDHWPKADALIRDIFTSHVQSDDARLGILCVFSYYVYFNIIRQKWEQVRQEMIFNGYKKIIPKFHFSAVDEVSFEEFQEQIKGAVDSIAIKHSSTLRLLVSYLLKLTELKLFKEIKKEITDRYSNLTIFSDIEHILSKLFNGLDYGNKYTVQLIDQMLLGLHYSYVADYDYGIYKTPNSLGQLLVTLSDPQKNDVVLDPCCGTGELLIKFDKYLKNKNIWHDPSSVFLNYKGWEEHILMACISTVRCELKLNNSIVSAMKFNGTNASDNKYANKIIFNPPFKVVDAHDILDQALDCLKPGGRLVAIMPRNFSFANNSYKLRKRIIQEFNLRAIFELPDKALKKYTKLKADIYVIENSPQTTTIISYKINNKIFSNEEAEFELLSKEYLENFEIHRKAIDEEERSMPDECLHINLVKENDYDFSIRQQMELDIYGAQLTHCAQLASESGSNVHIVTVESLVDVIIGVPNNSENKTLEGPVHEDDHWNAGGGHLLKMSEIENNTLEINKNIQNYIRDTAAEKYKNRKPKADDILFSIKGTIGKTYLFTRRDEDENIFHDQGLIALRIKDKARIIPEFLLELLKSKDFVETLKVYSRGTGVQSIPLKYFKAMSLPLPDLRKQLTVVENIKSIYGLSIYDSLSQAKPLNQGIPNHIVEKLNNIIFQSEVKKRKIDHANDATRPVLEAENYLQILHNHYNEIFRHLPEQDLNYYELNKDQLNKLKTCGYIFKRATHLNETRNENIKHQILTDATYEINKYLKHLQNEFSNEAERQIIQKLFNTVDALICCLIKHYEQDASVDIEIVKCNLIKQKEKLELTFNVQCHAGLPLKEFSILDIKTQNNKFNFHFIRTQPVQLIGEIDPDENYNNIIDTLFIPILEPGMQREESVILEVSDNAKPFEIGKQILTFSWQAFTISGKQCSGKHGITIDIQEPKERQSVNLQENHTIGDNPYICGPEISDPEKFIGREEIINNITDAFNNPDGGNRIEILEGNRRIGKSSILAQLNTRRELLPNWVIVHLQLLGGDGATGGAGVPTRKVWTRYTNQIIYELNRQQIELPWKEKFENAQQTQVVRELISSEGPFEDFNDFINQTLKIISPKRLLLMFDEYDKLQEGIDSGVTSNQVPENIRSLFSNPSIGGIITGTGKIKRIKAQYWDALYAQGVTPIDITSLATEDAKKVVTVPIELYYGQNKDKNPNLIKLEYNNEAIELIVNLCDNQPFLIQSICKEVFKRAKREPVWLVDKTLVEKTVKSILPTMEHFRNILIMGFMDPFKRYLLLVINMEHSIKRAQGYLEPVSYILLHEYFIERGFQVEEKMLGAGLQDLQELELITYHGKPRDEYSIRVPLMGLWLEMQDEEIYKRDAQTFIQDNI